MKLSGIIDNIIAKVNSHTTAIGIKKVKNVTTNTSTNRLVITYTDDTTSSLNIEDIVKDIHVSGATLDATTNILTLTSIDDGPNVIVNLSDFVNSSELATAVSTINNSIALKGNTNQVINTKDYYAISGQIRKPERTSFFGFTETTPNNLNISASDWYFKSSNKTVSTIGRSITFPTAPTGTNLVANGTFDINTSGWTAGTNTTLSIVSNRLRFTNTTTYSGWAYTSFPTVIGKKYVVELDRMATLSRFYSGTSAGAGDIYVSEYRTGYSQGTFVATSDTTYITIESASNIQSAYTEVDNIAVFASTDLLRYDNLMLREDGTYFTTQTENNLYDLVNGALTMNNFTSLLYSVDTGVSTGTSVTFTSSVVDREYSGSDGKKYITVGSTARFNQGAYHPVFNAYGSSTFDSASWWFEGTAISNPVLNISNTFTRKTSNIAWDGSIATSPNNGTGRPDSKYYDIIYNELFIDQRWKAEYLDGTKELTTKERDKDISASQYADFVGSATWETVGYTYNVDNDSTNAFNIHIGNNEYYKIIALIQSGKKVYATFISATNPSNNCVRQVTSWVGTVGYIDGFIFDRGYTSNTTGVYRYPDTKVTIHTESSLKYGSNTFLHTDIIGNPANYPQVWKDALAGGSIAGTPLLVGENGESLLPDGAIDNFKLTKKYNSVYNGIRYSSSSFTSFTQTTDAAGNYTILTNEASGNVVLSQYKAYNNNLSPIDNSRVIGGSAGVSDVYANNDYTIEVGCKAVSNMLNKISTNSTGKSTMNVKFYELPLKPFNLQLPKIDVIQWYGQPTHDTINLYGSTSPAVKIFSYLTQDANGVAKQVYVFKELKYGADWGDDSKFNIVDNVSTTTDDNGATILIGQKARLIDGRIKE